MFGGLGDLLAVFTRDCLSCLFRLVCFCFSVCLFGCLFVCLGFLSICLSGCLLFCLSVGVFGCICLSASGYWFLAFSMFLCRFRLQAGTVGVDGVDQGLAQKRRRPGLQRSRGHK